MKISTHPIFRLKHVMQKLQRVLLSSAWWEFYCKEWDQRISMAKEGCFAVLTMNDKKSKKFLVALSYLNHPAFQKLLEETELEFGFDQPGVLVVPCEASELQRILSEEVFCE
ncbi:hypothetical protein IFM89_034694 [Coptis chinensis]|uniref:Small auxin up regulated protein n=1 Tax=Coptis chinensis TaxID=261450 RepID=A0A835H8N7_9MAGN|nr:hypothetical protein IFM89_034694 [Coptis chinensis]